MTMRRFAALAVLLASLAEPAAAETVDRIAATIDRQVLTVSEISQLVEIRFFARTSESEDDHRRDILDALIAQALRYRDVERFSPQDISLERVQARINEIRGRFTSDEEFQAAMARAELTAEEVQALVKRQLQVEAYIQERFAPLVFVSNDEVEAYYNGPWSEQRRQRGLPVPPLERARSEVRTAVRMSRVGEEVGKWTTQLRARADVDIYAWR